MRWFLVILILSGCSNGAELRSSDYADAASTAAGTLAAPASLLIVKYATKANWAMILSYLTMLYPLRGGVQPVLTLVQFGVPQCLWLLV